MGTGRSHSAARHAVHAFGAYVRMLRENFHGKGRGKSLRQLARETGIAPSVLSRGERGLQDLRQVEYIDRLAPHLGVRGSVLKRVASMITSEDVQYFQTARPDFDESAGNSRERGAGVLLWARLTREVDRLRGASPETLEALISYVEFLLARERERTSLPAGDNRVN